MSSVKNKIDLSLKYCVNSKSNKQRYENDNKIMLLSKNTKAKNHYRYLTLYSLLLIRFSFQLSNFIIQNLKKSPRKFKLNCVNIPYMKNFLWSFDLFSTKTSNIILGKKMNKILNKWILNNIVKLTYKKKCKQKFLIIIKTYYK